MRYSEKGLFQALEKVLRETGKAMDCNELFDMASIKEYAASPNRVSDYLGGLWRKGLVVRLPTVSEGGAKARWAYQWKDNVLATVGTDYAPRLLVDRPTLVITEEGTTIQIAMKELTILIKTHRG
jgi:hypothetical protein